MRRRHLREVGTDRSVFGNPIYPPPGGVGAVFTKCQQNLVNNAAIFTSQRIQHYSRPFSGTWPPTLVR